MSRRSAVLAALVVLAVAPAAAAARGQVQLTAGFDPDAALGAATAVHLALHVDPRAPSPLSELQLLYPATLGVVSSGLGLETCERPESDFEQVIVAGPLGRGNCPANSVMGSGTVRADVRIKSTGQVIPEYATLVVLAGPIDVGRGLGLIVFIDGQRPFGGKFVLAADIRGAPQPFGGMLAMRLPVAPGLSDVATVSLVDFRVTIGARDIVYYEQVKGRRRAYHPEGIVLPPRCPKRGFRFRARVTFQDGRRETVGARAPCPAAAAERPRA